MADYFYIVSKLGGDLVMDVQGAASSPGTPIVVYQKKHRLFGAEKKHPGHGKATASQLWRKERVGDTTFYLVSKLGPEHKLVIQDGKAVISSFGSLLREESDGNVLHFLVVDGEKVLSVQGSVASNGTPIVGQPMSSCPTAGQQWEIYPEGT